jgi:thioredoxin-related protein
MRKIVFCILLGVSISIRVDAQVHNSQADTASHQGKFDPLRDAQKDIQDAVREAQKTHQRILLDVGGEWCIWCRRLDTLYMKNSDLDRYLHKYFLVVKINVSKENQNEQVLAHYPKVAGYPHIFILDELGNLLQSQDTGELEYPKESPVKGHDKAKVLAFLKKWAKE